MTNSGATHRTSEIVVRALATLAPNAEVRTLDASTRTAADAAEALGCEVGAIANSLVFVGDDQPVLIMTSGAHRVDLDVVGSTMGVATLRRATPDEVRSATGQPIGGVAPVGHPVAVRTFVDRDLAVHETIWAAAGTPHAVFATTYDELLVITDGTPLAVTGSEP